MKKYVINLSLYEFKFRPEIAKILINKINKYCSKEEQEFFLKLIKSKSLPTFFKNVFIKLLKGLDNKNSNKIYKDIISELKYELLGNKKFPFIDKSGFNKLMKHQIKSLNIAYNLVNSKHMNGYLLFDEPGLGKTKSTISVQKYLYDEFKFKKLLVICPLSLKASWKEVLEEEFKDLVIEDKEYSAKADICITTFESAQKYPAIFNSIIIDEAHILHNIDKNMYAHIFELCKASSIVSILTATPLRSSFIDIFSLYGLIDKSIENYDVFKLTYELIKSYSDFTFQIIKDNIKDVMILTTKEEVSNNVGDIHIFKLQSSIDDAILKEKSLNISSIDSNVEKMLKMIDVVKKEFNKLDDKEKEAMKISLSHNDEYNNKDPKLNAIFNFMYKFKDNHKSKLSLKEWNRLLIKTLELQFSDEYIKDVIEKVNKHKKVIIVTKSRKAIKPIINQFKQHKINGINLESSDNSQDRLDKVNKFQKDDDYSFIISTYEIIESGFNIHDANAIILLDAPYRPHSFVQIMHRFQRLNNIDKEVFIYILNIGNDDILYHDRAILEVYNVNYNNVMNELKEK